MFSVRELWENRTGAPVQPVAIPISSSFGSSFVRGPFLTTRSQLFLDRSSLAAPVPSGLSAATIKLLSLSQCAFKIVTFLVCFFLSFRTNGYSIMSEFVVWPRSLSLFREEKREWIRVRWPIHCKTLWLLFYSCWKRSIWFGRLVNIA